MSEFTSGSLSLLKYKELISEFSPTYLKELNDEWLVFFTEDTCVSEDIPDGAYKISEKVPLLYFYNFEDHCWGYSIVSNSQKIASVHISYEIETGMIIDLAAERYPEEEDLVEFIYMLPSGEKIREQLAEEIQSSSEYKELIHQQFIHCNLESFKLFGISDEQIRQLAEIINGEYYFQLKSKHYLVEEFKRILNIQEMSWIRSDWIGGEE